MVFRAHGAALVILQLVILLPHPALQVQGLQVCTITMLTLQFLSLLRHW